MGNRSFLYLCTADELARGDGRQIAEANNHFPLVWRVLLANGQAAAAHTGQRVFGDAGTSNLASDARQAQVRLGRLADALVQHPLRSTRPELPLYLEALQQVLASDIQAVGGPHGAVYLSANLDELSGLDGRSGPEFITRMATECRETWARLEHAIDAENGPALDEALELREFGGGFARWSAWNDGFGFGGFEHPYFQALEPRKRTFASFTASEGDAEDDWLGDHAQRFQQGDAVGVKRVVMDAAGAVRAEEILVPAEWDEIHPAHAPDAQVFWVVRGGQTGLMGVTPSGHRLVYPCELDEASLFAQGGTADVAVVRQGAHVGLLQSDGAWRRRPGAEPVVEQIFDFSGGFAMAVSGGRWGVMSLDGEWVVAPQWDDIEAITPQGMVIAVAQGQPTLLRTDGRAVQTPACDALTWHDGQGVFEIRQRGRIGWLREDASVCMAPEWQELQLLSSGHVAARRGRHWGLLDGQSGALRIPCAFARLEEVGFNGEEGCCAWLKVGQRVGRRPLRWGIWDLDAGRHIVDCLYRHIHPHTLFHGPDGPVNGFLVSLDTDQKTDQGGKLSAIGILRDDGQTLIPSAYAWVAERYDLDDPLDASLVARALDQAWSQNQPVQAAPCEGNEYQWLTREGGVIGHAQALQAKFAQGDFNAAWQLAQDYRDGVGLPADAAQAHRWALRAAGQSTAAPPPSSCSPRPARTPTAPTAPGWSMG